jgi:hypothetical protein
VNTLDKAKKLWEAFINFLTTYDSRRVSRLFDEMKWEEVLANPYVWLIGLPLLGYMLWKKRFKTIILLFSLAAFLYLIKATFPPSDASVPLDRLLKFIGGTVALCVLNLYLLFVRTD